MLLKVGPDGVSLLRVFRILSEARSSETVPKILVLLVTAAISLNLHIHILQKTLVVEASAGLNCILS